MGNAWAISSAPRSGRAAASGTRLPSPSFSRRARGAPGAERHVTKHLEGEPRSGKLERCAGDDAGGRRTAVTHRPRHAPGWRRVLCGSPERPPRTARIGGRQSSHPCGACGPGGCDRSARGHPKRPESYHRQTCRGRRDRSGSRHGHPRASQRGARRVEALRRGASRPRCRALFGWPSGPTLCARRRPG